MEQDKSNKDNKNKIFNSTNIIYVGSFVCMIFFLYFIYQLINTLNTQTEEIKKSQLNTEQATCLKENNSVNLSTQLTYKDFSLSLFTQTNKFQDCVKETLTNITESNNKYINYAANLNTIRADFLDKWLSFMAMFLTFMGVIFPLILAWLNKSYNDKIAKFEGEAEKTLDEIKTFTEKKEQEFNALKTKLEEDITLNNNWMEWYTDKTIKLQSAISNIENKEIINKALLKDNNTSRQQFANATDNNFSDFESLITDLKNELENEKSQFFSKKTKIKELLARSYGNRGNAYASKGEFDTAIKDYTKAIELNPNYAEAYYNRGNAYYKKGEFDTAIKDYTKAIELFKLEGNKEFEDIAENNKKIAEEKLKNNPNE